VTTVFWKRLLFAAVLAAVAFHLGILLSQTSIMPKTGIPHRIAALMVMTAGVGTVLLFALRLLGVPFKNRTLRFDSVSVWTGSGAAALAGDFYYISAAPDAMLLALLLGLSLFCFLLPSTNTKPRSA